MRVTGNLPSLTVDACAKQFLACCYQLDCGYVTHSELPGRLCDWLEDFNNNRAHNLAETDRRHFCKAIRLVYKFRSDRGAVHISTEYTANEMDSVLMLHVGKWMFAEFLRLAWTKDRTVIAETIADIIQLEHPVIHEVDGTPLVLDHNCERSGRDPHAP